MGTFHLRNAFANGQVLPRGRVLAIAKACRALFLTYDEVDLATRRT